MASERASERVRARARGGLNGKGGRFGVYKKHKIKFRSPRARNIRALVIRQAGMGDVRSLSLFLSLSLSSPMAFSGTLTIIRSRPGANSLTRVYRCPGRC